ncbi:MAG: UDP-N-acetylmuramate dehydrogenase [Defluviitaleaceae bacterium]|nr:UDP-N-acetylmuramate dehydrogenase [Defluviitaleaceae bacterium]
MAIDYNIFYENFASDKLLSNTLMSEYTSFKVGGAADLIIMPTNAEEVKKAINICNDKSFPYFIMGKGSNLLVGDAGYRGIIICMSKNLEKVKLVNDCEIKAEAGITLSKLAGFAMEYSLAGLEFASGIPGSLGGALYMNAGAYDSEMKDVVLSAELIDNKGNELIMQSNEMELGYRSSVFQKNNYIITNVTLKLLKGDKEQIKDKMSDLNGRRKEKQPLDLPSAGSTFKRPPNHFASKLIDEAGLKGFAVGGAKVSEKHAGFIVNYNNATASDIITLMEHVKVTVYEKFGVTLIPEVEIIGDF